MDVKLQLSSSIYCFLFSVGKTGLSTFIRSVILLMFSVKCLNLRLLLQYFWTKCMIKPFILPRLGWIDEGCTFISLPNHLQRLVLLYRKPVDTLNATFSHSSSPSVQKPFHSKSNDFSLLSLPSPLHHFLLFPIGNGVGDRQVMARRGSARAVINARILLSAVGQRRGGRERLWMPVQLEDTHRKR